MYMPTLNRFTARDPLSADGVDVIPNTGWFGQRLDAMRRSARGAGPGGDLNLYRYVGNNPTGLVDPSGLFFISIHVAITEDVVNDWADLHGVSATCRTNVRNAVV